MLSCKNIGLLFLFSTCSVTSFLPTEERCPQQLHCFCSVISTGLKVDCSGRGFITVPSQLPHNTTELILNDNALRRLPNNSFTHVTLLLNLFIENASLEDINVGAFRGLDVLELLSLRNNKRLGIYNNSLQPEIFQYVINLKHLLINQNQALSGNENQYPTGIFSHLTRLEELVIDGVNEKPLGSEMLKLRNLSILRFNGMQGTCNLKHIRGDFFKNIPSLKYIQLIDCNTEYIHKNAFSPLYQIVSLDVSFNQKLGLDGFEEGSKGLANSTISELFLNKLYPTFGVDIELTVSSLQWLTNTRLRRLEINSNRLENFQVGVLNIAMPKTLTSLSVADNRLSYGYYFWQFNGLTNLQYMDVSRMFTSHDIKNAITDVDTRCFTTCKKTRLGSNLLIRPYEHNSLQKLPSWLAPRNLSHVNASHMALKYTIPELSFGKNVVERIDLHDNTLYSWQGPVYGFNKLKWLDLSNNFCTNVSKYFFDFVPSLEVLLIHNNLLSYSLEGDIEGNIFRNVRNLRNLTLSYNRIHHIPENIFRNLRNLSWLDLSNNRLRVFNISLRSMPLLSHLDLRNNFITNLPEVVRIDLDDFDNKLEILLEGNPLDCSCMTLPFVRWLSNTKVLIVSMNKLLCSFGEEDRNLQDIQEIINLLDRSCRDYTPFILTAAGGLLLSSIAICTMAIYRYRWKLRYFYYVSRAKYQGVRESGDHDFIYDAFISYADEDRKFVTNDLINKLEKEAGLKLCIHHRDFVPGRWIPDNIAGAVHNSRKCIFLLSKDFFESHWCKFEYNMARVEEMHSGRDILILVSLGYVPTRVIPAEIWEQMEVATYITYHPPPRNGTFWTNLKTALAN